VVNLNFENASFIGFCREFLDSEIEFLDNVTIVFNEDDSSLSIDDRSTTAV